jgi:two-component system sensor histidine kinase DegS
MVDITILDKILDDVINKIEEGKTEIYEIAEYTRQECFRVKKAMFKIKQDTLEIVKLVDYWEKEEKKARFKLAEVSKNFSIYGEEDIKNAYDKARDIQIRLAHLREKEKQYKQRRLELEQQYKSMEYTARKAENLVTQIGAVMSYLSSNLRNVQAEAEQLNSFQDIGLAVIRAQEDERRRIARGIHDGPAQLLANIVLRIEYCEKILNKRPEALPEELSQLKVFARNTLTEIRKVLFDLRPIGLGELGLIEALKKYLDDIKEKNNIRIKFLYKTCSQKCLPEVDVAVFRIIQESINNTIKHSQASEIQINLEITSKRVHVVIVDDGVGFNVGQKLKNNQFGLRGMQEWARILGGETKISSEPNMGTRVSASIPFRR